MKKVAITLPDDQAEAVERLRRKMRVPRSRVIQRAISYYLSEQDRYRAIRAYEEGYRRLPEGTEAEVFVRVAAASLAEEDWE